jgi:hypothetical protein
LPQMTTQRDAIDLAAAGWWWTAFIEVAPARD